MNNLLLLTMDLFGGTKGETTWPVTSHLENDMEHTLFFNDIYAKMMIPTAKQVTSDYINQILYQYTHEGLTHFEDYDEIVRHYLSIYENYYQSVYSDSLAEVDSVEIKNELDLTLQLILEHLRWIPELQGYHCFKVEYRSRLMLCFMLNKKEAANMNDEEIFIYLKGMGWLP